MFCIMVKCKVRNYLIMIIELKITIIIIIVYLYFCLVTAAVVVDYDDVLFFFFFFFLLLLLFGCMYVPFFSLLLSFSFLDFSLGSAYL